MTNNDTAARARRDAEATKQDILAVATAEFAENGLSGARVDAIAARTRTTKRMIYYYFGSKEGLYVAVLEKAYADIRSVEQHLDLTQLGPAEALRRLVEFTFDYQESHPDFIRLVAIENIHNGKYLAQSSEIRRLNTTVIDTIATILARGRHDGVFHTDIDPVDLHMLISAFCFFRVANRHTFGTLFDRDLNSPELRARHKPMIGDAIIRLLAVS
ncbi:MAG TPA: TetR/AcrR family transcriptional regulator [Acetobacteraceae bacterium]|nr:TetR/AcrR family transcriptional regulator [Acetobacteraceae bacterium]